VAPTQRIEPVRRRACLAVPGSSARKLEKAQEIAVLEVVIDLEDGVAPEAKHRAREAALAAIGAWSGSARPALRINGRGSDWYEEDVRALEAAPAALGSVVLPKVESARDVARLSTALEAAERSGGERVRPIGIQALIETPAGLLRLEEIAAGSPRLEALILGYADLGAALGGSRGLDAWLPAQHEVLLIARALGIQAIDGPHLGLELDAGFAAGVARARELGFDGKWAIHPDQVEPLVTAFAPTPAELRWARSVVAALERAEAAGEGVVALDGQMLDEPVRLAALRVLAGAGEGAPLS
jgi:citrate lyase subunit beta/citryl-CoA lyase